MNRIIKITILLVAVLQASLVYAGGIAGEDRYILVKDGEPEPITLTAEGGGSDCCYQWTTSDGIILSETDKQSITIKPVSPKSTFTVKRACLSGEESGSVTVNYNDFTIESVTPKYGCFSSGDDVNINDYTIVTNPAGYEEYVEAVTKNYSSLFQSTTMSVVFEKKAGKPQTISTTVTVINDQKGLGVGGEVGILGAIDAIRNDFEELSKEIEKVLDEVASKGKMSPCKLDGFTPTGNVGFSERALCCQNNNPPIKEVINAAGGIGFSIGGRCDIAIVGIPGLASINGRLSVGVSGSVEISYEQQCDAPEICATGSVGIDLGLGASATVLGGALIDAAVMLEASPSASVTACVSPKPSLEVGSVCFDLTLVANVTVFSFIDGSIEYPLVSLCSPPLYKSR